MILEIKDLHVEVGDKEILKGVNFSLDLGKVNALMGPNGSGKSTLAHVIAGHPDYKITKGQIIFNGENITNLDPSERAKKGLFLSFQYPQEISGVPISQFLRTAYNAVKEEKKSLLEFQELLKEKANLLGIDESFLQRYLNEGFSGGEKKKSEVLQLLVLNPKFSILDETDSGLDIDALKIVAQGVNQYMNENKGSLIITHYKRILEHIIPDKILVMIGGKIVEEGGVELVNKLESEGYSWLK